MPPQQMNDQLTQGGQLLLYQVLHLLCIIMLLFPVWNIFNAWYLTQVYEGEWLTDTVGYVYLGVNLVPTIGTIIIGISIITWYFYATNQRKYQSQYTGYGEIADGYNQR
jgi:hypothetical protein